MSAILQHPLPSPDVTSTLTRVLGMRIACPPEDRWKSQDLDAVKLAKNGNSVVRTAVARAIIESSSNVVSSEEIVELITPAVQEGYPPAFLLQAMNVRYANLVERAASMVDALAKAARLGSHDAICLSAMMAYGAHMTDANTMRDVLDASHNSILTFAYPVVTRLMQEAEETTERLCVSEKELSRLRQQTSLDADQRRRIRDLKSHTKQLGEANAMLTRQVALLSEGSLKRKNDELEATLSTLRQQLADANTLVNETRRTVDARIADSVKDLREQAERYQLERDVAAEERDGELRQVDNLNRKVKRLEACMRRHGLDPVTCEFLPTVPAGNPGGVP